MFQDFNHNVVNVSKCSLVTTSITISFVGQYIETTVIQLFLYKQIHVHVQWEISRSHPHVQYKSITDIYYAVLYVDVVSV